MMVKLAYKLEITMFHIGKPAIDGAFFKQPHQFITTAVRMVYQPSKSMQSFPLNSLQVGMVKADAIFSAL